MKNLIKQTRREFIKVVGLSGGGLFLASYVPFQNVFAIPGDEPKIVITSYSIHYTKLYDSSFVLSFSPRKS